MKVLEREMEQIQGEKKAAPKKRTGNCLTNLQIAILAEITKDLEARVAAFDYPFR